MQHLSKDMQFLNILPYFTRPKVPEDVYGYVMFGDYQQKVVSEEDVKYKHSWFRIPCVGNTWSPCTDWPTQCDCPTEVMTAGFLVKVSTLFFLTNT